LIRTQGSNAQDRFKNAIALIRRLRAASADSSTASTGATFDFYRLLLRNAKIAQIPCYRRSGEGELAPVARLIRNLSRLPS